MMKVACVDCHFKSRLIDELDYALLEERNRKDFSGELAESRKREREWRLNHKQQVIANRRERERVRAMYPICNEAHRIANESKITVETNQGIPDKETLVTVMLGDHVSDLATALARAGAEGFYFGMDD